MIYPSIFYNTYFIFFSDTIACLIIALLYRKCEAVRYAMRNTTPTCILRRLDNISGWIDLHTTLFRIFGAIGIVICLITLFLVV